MPAPPDWRVDPAAPAVPEDDPDECWRAPPCAPASVVAPGLGILEARHARDEMRIIRTRYAITLRRARRLAVACTAAAMAPPPAPPKKKGGHPGHRVRNDRLLVLFERTNPGLPHLTRCHHAAVALAAEYERLEGPTSPRARVMKTATARDAIKEARRHRDELALRRLFTDEQPPTP